MIRALAAALVLASAVTLAWFAGRASIATETHAKQIAQQQRDYVLGDCRHPCPIPEKYEQWPTEVNPLPLNKGRK